MSTDFCPKCGVNHQPRVGCIGPLDPKLFVTFPKPAEGQTHWEVQGAGKFDLEGKPIPEGRYTEGFRDGQSWAVGQAIKIINDSTRRRDFKGGLEDALRRMAMEPFDEELN